MEQGNSKRSKYHLDRKRPLTDQELLEALEESSSEEADNSSNVEDFDSDDSIQDEDFIYESENSLTCSENSVSRFSLENLQVERENGNASVLNTAWNDVTGYHQQDFQFDGMFGINPNINVEHISVLDCYQLFITEDILQLIVTETNRNAQQVHGKKGSTTKKSRLSAWKPTTLEEIRKFIGLLLYMGLVKYPSIESYWSKKPIYKNAVAPQVMSRNRFQSLMRFLHFANNEDPAAEGNRLHKIDALVSHLNSRYKEIMQPGKIIAIDETMIPFRGRLGFRQYIPGKRHKYGVKVFKMCDQKGYTHSLSIYQGKNDANSKSLATNVVMQLCEEYLDHGRIVVTDNFYTSLPLATDLLNRKTHTVGTLRQNRKGLPKEVTTAKIKKGDIIGKENEKGIVVLKWKDKREVHLLSTYHNLDIVSTGKKNRIGEDIMKPQSVIDYNSGKAGIDMSDQMSSYSTPVRKSIRWYHKVAVELLMGTTVVNALVLYKAVHSESNICITKFREELVTSILDFKKSDENRTKKGKHNHIIEETDQKCSRNRKIRKRCFVCYRMFSEKYGHISAAKMAKKVTTFCATCPEKPFVCMKCFPNHI